MLIKIPFLRLIILLIFLVIISFFGHTQELKLSRYTDSSHNPITKEYAKYKVIEYFEDSTKPTFTQTYINIKTGLKETEILFIYENGNEVSSSYKGFDDMERLIETSFTESGKMHGVQKEYDSSGKLQRINSYRKGIMVSTQIPGERAVTGKLQLEVPSSYIGGMPALKKYLRKEFKKVKKGLDSNIWGQIVARFTIDGTGSVTNVKIIKSLDPTYDISLVRALQHMPPWQPELRLGKTRTRDYTLLVSFYNGVLYSIPLLNKFGSLHR